MLWSRGGGINTQIHQNNSLYFWNYTFNVIVFLVNLSGGLKIANFCDMDDFGCFVGLGGVIVTNDVKRLTVC